jgi:hypothetical protein
MGVGVVTVTGVVITQTGGAVSPQSATFSMSVIENMTSAGSFGGNAQFPTGVIGDQSRLDVYFAASNSNEINAINGNPGGADPDIPTVLSRPMNFGSGLLNHPFGLALSTESPAPLTLWATNFLGGNGANTTGLGAGSNPTAVTFTGAGTKCANPEGMSQDSSDNTGYWVACGGSGGVAVLNLSGVFQRFIPLPACSKGAAVPSGVTADNQNGFVFVADARCDALYELSTTAVTATLTTGLPTNAFAANVAFSTKNCQCVYVAEPGANEVQQILISSSTSMSVRNTLSVGTTGCLRPYGVATDETSGGTLAVSCAGTTSFTSPEAEFYTIGNPPTLNYTVPLPNGNVPAGIADIPGSGGRNNEAYIATEFGNSVIVVDPPSGHHKLPRLAVAPFDPATQAAAARAVDQLHPLYP